LNFDVLLPVPDGSGIPSNSSEASEQESGDKTVVESLNTHNATEEDSDRTIVDAGIELELGSDQHNGGRGSQELVGLAAERENRNIAREKTIVFQRPTTAGSRAPVKKGFSLKELVRKTILGVILGVVGYQFLLAEPKKKPLVRIEPIRPKLPSYIEGRSDSKKSEELYSKEGIRFYLEDTVAGYRKASEQFRESASYDSNNVRALAMLASSYLNLIDVSNKDENYFSVISKLIDMSRAKAVDLPETVIADVEFFLVVNKAEAAQNRIVEYTKTHQNYGIELFYYLALCFMERGDAATAARYLSQFPDNKVFSAKIFYLKGRVAEKLNDIEAAMRDYNNAVRFNPQHAKSHLKIAYLLNKQGALKESARHLEFLVNHPTLLASGDLGLTYYLHAQLSELFGKWDIALGDVERAVKLDPENHDYLLELYTLQAKAGGSLKKVQPLARMYYFLGEGEKLVQTGKYQEAIIPFLQARQANDSSPIPLLKMGDMFSYLNDIENAKMNYKLASERAPGDIHVWSKYIKTLIQSFEWEEASKAMDKFRKLPVSQSSIDKAAADMYQKQGRPIEAQTFYKKAMGRDVIDTEVYIDYAKSLMSTKNYKDAPFFFALALRFDPLNVEVIINTAKCVAETDSIDRAISMLQDELQQSTSTRAEYLAAIAEFQTQKGAWDLAQQSVDQAMQANPNYAYPWKIQAQIYMNREGLDKDALDRALFAYKSYSERNHSDPSGYLERYKIFIKKTEYEHSKEELTKIYNIYPKYPNLHYYLGALYSVQGNHREAAEEMKRELQNNPNMPKTMFALGKELLELNAFQGALDLFTKVMQMEPNNPDAKQNAGWANYKLGNFQAAVALIRAALSIDKANPILYRRMGIVQRDTGDPVGACASFRKYLEMEPDASDKAEFKACL